MSEEHAAEDDVIRTLWVLGTLRNFPGYRELSGWIVHEVAREQALMPRCHALCRLSRDASEDLALAIVLDKPKMKE
jgi:hypothetical protein